MDIQFEANMGRMPIGGWLMLASGVVAWIGNSYYRLRSLAHLSESGKRRRSAILDPRGWRANRQDFTDRGWIYRRRAWQMLALLPIMFAFVALFQKWLL